MMAAVQTADSYAADYESIAGQLPGFDQLWLQVFRHNGLQVFNQHGFPNTREEEWRYTNLAILNKFRFVPKLTAKPSAGFADAYCLPHARSLMFINGVFSQAHSDLSGLPTGVKLLPLHQALQQNPGLLQSYLGKAVDDGLHSLIAFNNAWFTDGLVVEIAENCQLDKPLQILHVVTETEALAATRNILVLGKNAKAEIIETFLGSTPNYFTAVVNECFLDNHAELTWHKIQLEAENAAHFGGTYLKQADNSRFTHHQFSLGGLLARNDIHTDLQTAAECFLYGVYLGENRQHLDHHTRINHLKPQGKSREYYKGVLGGRARGVFQGRVIVSEQAQQTDSEMQNRNLLLSVDAEVDTKPQLEIYADDVKCSHGVTVGQLEEKSVFYLQSRGLDEVSAKNVLTFAFANEMVEKLENPQLKALLLQQLLIRFPTIKL